MREYVPFPRASHIYDKWRMGLEHSSAGIPYIVLDYLCRDTTSIISEVSNSEEVLPNSQSDDLHEFTHHLPSKVSNNRCAAKREKQGLGKDKEIN